MLIVRIVRYPKSGEVNPTIKVFVRELAESVNKEVQPPPEVTNWGEYIVAVVTWVDLDTVRYIVAIVTWVDLDQSGI
jgi:hypothetical protein